MADENTRVGGFSMNKFIVAVMIFIVIGFVIDKFASYTQQTVTQDKLEERSVVGDELLKTAKENNVMLKQLIEKLDNIENKLDSKQNTNSNTGKSVK